MNPKVLPKQKVNPPRKVQFVSAPNCSLFFVRFCQSSHNLQELLLGFPRFVTILSETSAWVCDNFVKVQCDVREKTPKFIDS